MKLLTVCALALSALAADPPRNLGPVAAAGKLLQGAGGLLASYAVTASGGESFLAVSESRDQGLTWSSPRRLSPLPGSGWGGLVVLRDRQGELQFVITRIRGNGTRIAVDRFIDLWHIRSLRKGTAWSDPQRIFEGYVGSIQQIAELRGGRLLLPFAAWIGGRPSGPPTGPNEVTAVYSDDHGSTWRLSPSRLTAPVATGYNGSAYGAIEPSVLERRDGTLWMLMRTQTGYFYESFSADGTEWKPATRSSIRASTGPPYLLRLPDNRVVLFWNHCEMPPRVDGQGVYGGRDALHAAISSDDGRTWRGYREVYRDPFRNDPPPKAGDRGTAYPYATVLAGGKVGLISGQGESRRALIILDPDWLLESRASASLAGALADWSVFLGVGPAAGWWRDRKQGARLQASDAEPALELASRPGLPSDVAAWNFPMGSSGAVSFAIKGEPGELELSQRFFDPGDPQAAAGAAFRLPLPPATTWRRVRVEWDGTNARMKVDGTPAAESRSQHPEEQGVSYLRLRSTGGTFLVRDVDAAISR